MSSILIYNANILSFHSGFQKGQGDALLTEGNRIKAIGRYEELKQLAASTAEVIDAEGKTLMPGFNDTHIHIWKVGNLETYMLDVRGVASMDDMLEMLGEYNEKYPEAVWITARGFNEALWKSGKLPTAQDIDRVISHKPVYIIRTCAHIAVANTKAMQLANITASTTVPTGGVMHLDENGKPNGIFSETALGLITSHIPPYSKEQLKTMVKAARDEFYRYGITAATDPAVDPLLLQAYHEMNKAQELGFRLNALPIILPDGGEEPYSIPQLFDSDFFQVNTVKFFSDGGLSGKTAALNRHYKNSTDQGVLRLQQEQYVQLCRQAMEKGLGVATHAIGDAAIEFVIDIYKRLHADFPAQIKRIEHLGLPLEKHLQDMQAYHIATSMQTIFLHELGRNFIKYLDEDYLNHCYPVKSVLQHGILAALSSDAPVVKDFNPLMGVQSAVTRTTSDGDVIARQEAITVEQALRCYTSNAAAISATDEYGSIEPGKLADFILLDRNPLTVSPQELSTVTVQQTFVDGKLVWEM
ncbi:amidohydrolase [Foetidibacter luteolus]|uniref:amidohydrolase n=1 Tax=Foetidibacter luteolus TaxID=2608880 RepID=UPI001A99A9A5|nr:amidohydrolase [Foetidibacter luteolus]